MIHTTEEVSRVIRARHPKGKLPPLDVLIYIGRTCCGADEILGAYAGWLGTSPLDCPGLSPEQKGWLAAWRDLERQGLKD